MSKQDNVKLTSLYEKREKIHVKEISGHYQTLRNIVLTITLGTYFIVPWFKWNHHQAILLDLPHRNFHIFGLTFWPQDFFLLVGALLIMVLIFIFLTTLAGRIWCGYTCPQTVWTKVYMWVERFTEGSRIQRIRLDNQKFTFEKIIRRTIKHAIWLFVAAMTAVTFVGFFMPIDQLILALFHCDLGAWEFFFIAFFTMMTYLNAGFMREQICLYMCPYARFQGTMFDKDTLIISYDTLRGEPRGSRKRGVDPKQNGLGDCIDCHQCVQVCPTAIDIREGLQIACIGCAACIDACNQVMDKMQYPRNLIHYSTEHKHEGKKTHIIRPRLIANAIILLMIIFAFTFALFMRIPLRLDIIKERTRLFTVTSDGNIRNDYLLKIINMSQEKHTYQIIVTGSLKWHYIGEKKVTIDANQLVSLPVSVAISPSEITNANPSIVFTVTDIDNPKWKVSHENRFIIPNK